jgi:YesN/AraC family two-component response regulator
MNLQPIKIIIADDHEVYRDGLKLMLAKEKAYTIVGEAENGLELVELAKHSSPDIILTDIKMPKADMTAPSVSSPYPCSTKRAW